MSLLINRENETYTICLRYERRARVVVQAKWYRSDEKAVSLLGMVICQVREKPGGDVV